MVLNYAHETAIEASSQQSQLALGAVEAISLEETLQIIASQVTLSKRVDCGKSIMNIESGSPSALLLSNLNSLIDMEVNLNAFVEDVSRLFRKVKLLRHLFIVNVSGLPVLQLVLIIRIFWSERFTEVRVLEAGIVVTIKATNEMVDVIFVGMDALLVKESQDLWR